MLGRISGRIASLMSDCCCGAPRPSFVWMQQRRLLIGAILRPSYGHNRQMSRTIQSGPVWLHCPAEGGGGGGWRERRGKGGGKRLRGFVFVCKFLCKSVHFSFFLSFFLIVPGPLLSANFRPVLLTCCRVKATILIDTGFGIFFRDFFGILGRFFGMFGDSLTSHVPYVTETHQESSRILKNPQES